MKPRYRLRLSKLQFCSVVDQPAQPNAKTLLIKRDDAGDQVSATAKFVKLDEGLGLAFFWAFTSTNPDGSDHHDLQGDQVVADDEMVKAAMDFMTDGGGAVDQMHDGVPSESSRVVFAMPMNAEIASAYYSIDTKQSGLMIAIKCSPDVLDKLKNKTYGGVSIAGIGERVPVTEKSSSHSLTDGATNMTTKNSKPTTMLVERVVKLAAMTDEQLGHQHAIDLACPSDGWGGSLSTSYATAAGADTGHSHSWTFDPATGAVTVAADSGHVHAVFATVPVDVLAAAAAREQANATERAKVVAAAQVTGASTVVVVAAPDATPPAPDATAALVDSAAKRAAASGREVTSIKAGTGHGRPLVHLRGAAAIEETKAWLGSMADDAERIHVAKLNPDSWWAGEWIQKGRELDEAVAIQKRELDETAAVEKAIEDIYKRKLDAEANIKSYVEGVAKERDVSYHKALGELLHNNDATLARLHNEHSEAEHAFHLAPTELTKAATDTNAARVASLRAELDKMIEAFSLQHDYDNLSSIKRLRLISPTFKNLWDQYAEAAGDLNLAVNLLAAQNEQRAMIVMEKAYADQHAAAAADSMARTKVRETPAEAQLREHKESYAKQHACSFDQATAKTINDPIVKTLHRVILDEHAARVMGQHAPHAN